MDNQPLNSSCNPVASIRLSLTLATAALLAVGIAGCKKSTASKGDDARRQATEQLEAAKRTMEEANAKQQAITEAENKKAEATERKIEEARKQREAESARGANEEEDKRRMQAEHEERERVGKERQTKAAEEEAAKQAQAESLKVAEEVFGRISLNPQITLTGALKKANVTAELKGQDLEQFRALFAAKDWLGVLKAIGKVGADAQNLPPAKDVQKAVDEFTKSKAFPILIKAPVVPGDRFLATINDLSYWLVSLSERSGEDRISAMPIRTKHPDGIGYVVDWHPALGNVAIVAASSQQMEMETVKVGNMLAQLREGLKTKIRLGEISKEDAEKQLAEARAQSRTRFLEWAETTASTLNPTLSGIGASLAPKGKVVEVTGIIAGGPAQKSGLLKVGDRIVAIGAGDPPNVWGRLDLRETSPTERAREYNEVLMELRGPAGSAVYLKVQPAGTDDPANIKEIKIIRAQFEIK